MSLPRWTRIPEHRLVLVLLGAFTVVLLLGAAIPQQATTSPVAYVRWRQELAPFSFWLEAAGLTAVARSPLLAVITLPLLASLGHCTVRRSTTLARQWLTSGVSLSSLLRLGSILFHGSLLIGLAAVVLSSASRFAGYTELAPGLSVVDVPDRYLASESGWLTPAPTGLTVRLDDLLLEMWPDGKLKEHLALVSVLRDGQVLARSELSRSQPAALAGLTILLGSRTGPAALLTIEDERGRHGGWIHFATWPVDKPTEQAFVVPRTSLRLVAMLEDATPEQPEAAVLVLRPFGGHERQGGAPMTDERRLRPGEEAAFGEYRLGFAAVEGWTVMTIVRDPFIGWAFGAFWVGLAGLALVMLLPGLSRSGQAGKP